MNGSLLHNRLAGSPCLATISTMNAAIAEFSTYQIQTNIQSLISTDYYIYDLINASAVTPASSNLIFSFCDLIHWARI